MKGFAHQSLRKIQDWHLLMTTSKSSWSNGDLWLKVMIWGLGSMFGLQVSLKLRPRTKHIALKYKHFREHVRTGKIRINAIDTREQLADIFTKPLPRVAFIYLRHKLCGW